MFEKSVGWLQLLIPHFRSSRLFFAWLMLQHPSMAKLSGAGRYWYYGKKMKVPNLFCNCKCSLENDALLTVLAWTWILLLRLHRPKLLLQFLHLYQLLLQFLLSLHLLLPVTAQVHLEVSTFVYFEFSLLMLPSCAWGCFSNYSMMHNEVLPTWWSHTN